MSRFARAQAVFCLVAALVGCRAPQPPQEATRVDEAPREMPCNGRIPSSVLAELVATLHASASMPVFLPTDTQPLFFFEDLPEVVKGDPGDGKRLAHEARSKFHRESTPADTVAARLAYASPYDPQDSAACRDETVGIWVEVSPVLYNPLRRQCGLFVRTTPKACMPFGGSRYWCDVARWAGGLLHGRWQ
jgi:hypothetical protein